MKAILFIGLLGFTVYVTAQNPPTSPPPPPSDKPSGPPPSDKPNGPPPPADKPNGSPPPPPPSDKPNGPPPEHKDGKNCNKSTPAPPPSRARRSDIGQHGGYKTQETVDKFKALPTGSQPVGEPKKDDKTAGKDQPAAKVDEKAKPKTRRQAPIDPNQVQQQQESPVETGDILANLNAQLIQQLKGQGQEAQLPGQFPGGQANQLPSDPIPSNPLDVDDSKERLPREVNQPIVPQPNVPIVPQVNGQAPPQQIIPVQPQPNGQPQQNGQAPSQPLVPIPPPSNGQVPPNGQAQPIGQAPPQPNGQLPAQPNVPSAPIINQQGPPSSFKPLAPNAPQPNGPLSPQNNAGHQSGHQHHSGENHSAEHFQQNGPDTRPKRQSDDSHAELEIAESDAKHHLESGDDDDDEIPYSLTSRRKRQEPVKNDVESSSEEEQLPNDPINPVKGRSRRHVYTDAKHQDLVGHKNKKEDKEEEEDLPELVVVNADGNEADDKDQEPDDDLPSEDDSANDSNSQSSSAETEEINADNGEEDHTSGPIDEK